MYYLIKIVWWSPKDILIHFLIQIINIIIIVQKALG